MKKFNIPEFYRSPVIGGIKEHRRLQDKLKKDFSPTVLDFGASAIHLARHFGFCYGVENAVEIAYKTLDENPGKRIFLLSEMIHNPEVNEDLLSRGVKFLMDTSGNTLIDWATLNPDDIVIVPAFGTTLEIQEKLNKIGIDPYNYDTTCPFVEKVWNRAAQIGKRGYTIIVHGKPKHEETRATFSHSKENTPTLVLKNIEEAKKLSKYIKGESSKELFFEEFKNQYSEDFDPEQHLKRIGVVNQTTMLASETQEISDYLKSVIQQHYQLDDDSLQTHFANTRDTLCYATNDNQEATYELLKTKADLAIVVGGYNSSNTSHLVELCEQRLPTYFIRSAESLISDKTIKHFDLHKKEEITTQNYLTPKEKLNILLTCGASCPDAIMEAVLIKLHSFFQNNVSIKGVIQEMNIEVSHID